MTDDLSLNTNVTPAAPNTSTCRPWLVVVASPAASVITCVFAIGINLLATGMITTVAAFELRQVR